VWDGGWSRLHAERDQRGVGQRRGRGRLRRTGPCRRA